MTCELLVDPGWENLVILYIAFHFFILLHELAHAFKAAAFKVKVCAIHVGMGPCLFKLACFSFPIYFHFLPFTGKTLFNAQEFHYAPLFAQLLIYLAGPLSTFFFLSRRFFLATCMA